MEHYTFVGQVGSLQWEIFLNIINSLFSKHERILCHGKFTTLKTSIIQLFNKHSGF